MLQIPARMRSFFSLARQPTVSKRRGARLVPCVEGFENRILLSIIHQYAKVSADINLDAVNYPPYTDGVSQSSDSSTPTPIGPASLSKSDTVADPTNGAMASYAFSADSSVSDSNSQSGDIAVSASLDVSTPDTTAFSSDDVGSSDELDFGQAQGNYVLTINYGANSPPLPPGFAFRDRPAVTITLDGKSLPLDQGQGKFLLDGSSYHFLKTSVYVSTDPTVAYGINVSYAASCDVSWEIEPAQRQQSQIALVSAPNPSTYGQPVTFTATVSPATSGMPTPTGTVTFMDGSTVIGTSDLNASGIATFTTSTLAVGTHSITAVYGGDSTFSGSTSQPLSQVVQLTGSLTAYRPITEEIDYQQHPIPRSIEAATGVGIRIDGQPSSSLGEPDDDLIRIDIKVAAPTPPAGIQYELETTNRDLFVWADQTKQTLLLGSTEAPISLNSPVMTAWVEWANPYRGTSDLELVAKNMSTGQTIALDTISFHTFTSDVILFAGEQFIFPPPNPGGMLTIATAFYDDGYDVHMYVPGFNVVDLSTGLTEAFQEIENAVDFRGVTQIAIAGHSHGGGATYELASMVTKAIRSRKLTSIFGAITIPFTGYIDAIENTNVADRKPESRIPPGTQYLLNIYQTNSELRSLFVHGIPIKGADNVNVTAPYVNHNNIVNLKYVQMLIIDGVIQRVSR